jgi:hypothetical protein
VSSEDKAMAIVSALAQLLQPVNGRTDAPLSSQQAHDDQTVYLMQKNISPTTQVAEMAAADNVEPLVAVGDELNDIASAAATPNRNINYRINLPNRKVSEFFRKVPTAEHIQHNDSMMAPDNMDLRNVFKSGVAFGKA